MRTKDLVLHINETRDTHQPHFEGQLNVRYQLFGYLLEGIGWDRCNPEQCAFEFIEVEGKAASGMLFNQQEEPIILFDTKAIKENLDNHIDQTKKYFRVENSVKVAILTNMIDMFFFSDFETPGVMDETPFYKIHLPSHTDEDIAFLEQFQRDYFLEHFQGLYDKWKHQYTVHRETNSLQKVCN